MNHIKIFSTGFILALSLISLARASDNNIGINNSYSPKFDGERAITARFRIGNYNMFQEPFRLDVPNGHSRLVLEYKRTDNFPSNRKIVAKVKLGTGNSQVEIVLPQGQLDSFYGSTQNLPDDIVLMNSNYYLNPEKIGHGSVVYYRWCIETQNSNQCGDVHSFTMPHPLVFGIMGDSYGAGEGAPHSEDSDRNTVSWVDRDSHRSRNSGLYQAVQKFKKRYPQLWVESKFVAISGATIISNPDEYDEYKGGFLIDAIGDTEPMVHGTWLTVAVGYPPVAIPVPIPTRFEIKVQSQFEQVGEWLADNSYDRLHVLLMSAGGNDAGFTKVIGDAVVGTLRFLFPNTLEYFRDNLDTLKEFTEQEFKPALSDLVPTTPRSSPNKIIWTTYPNMTKDQNNQHSSIIADVSFNPALMWMDLTVGGDDMVNANKLLVEELNPAIREICEDILDQCVIAEVENTAQGHGINATPEQRWFNTFQDAQDEVQGSLDGAVHPNKNGYALYVDPVFSQLEMLYRPVRGSEYQLMAKQLAKEKLLDSTKKRVFNNRFGISEIKDQQIARRPNLSGVTINLSQENRSAARQQVRLATEKRQRRSEDNANKYKYRDIRQTLVRDGKLRLVLPNAKQVAQIQEALTKARKTEDLKKFNNMITRLQSNNGRISADVLRNRFNLR